jgi:hypothetical protein
MKKGFQFLYCSELAFWDRPEASYELGCDVGGGESKSVVTIAEIGRNPHMNRFDRLWEVRAADADKFDPIMIDASSFKENS